jgi:hypothetical protein
MMPDDISAIRKVYRDPLFDRTLGEVRSLGGYGTVVAAKADDFIRLLTGRTGGQGRDRFHFTRKGEYRIRNCRKVDLGCGYRIVCIQKDHRLVLLFIGTHDDCFRWIERHRTAEYDLDGVPEEAWTAVLAVRPAEQPRREPEHDEERLAEEYEESLIDKIDDAVLRKVFAGLVNGRT